MGMSAKNVRGPNINVTPLIDVLLVLLIIFMVVTPSKPHKIETKVPEKPDKVTENLNPSQELLVLTINKDRKLELNTEAITAEDLGSRLKDIIEKRPQDQRTLFIKAPKELPYGFIVNLVDIAKGAGVAPIGLQVDFLDA